MKSKGERPDEEVVGVVCEFVCLKEEMEEEAEIDPFFRFLSTVFSSFCLSFNILISSATESPIWGKNLSRDSCEGSSTREDSNIDRTFPGISGRFDTSIPLVE